MTLLKYLTSLLLVCSLVAGPLTSTGSSQAGENAVKNQITDQQDEPEGLTIRLSQAAAQPEQRVPTTLTARDSFRPYAGC